MLWGLEGELGEISAPDLLLWPPVTALSLNNDVFLSLGDSLQAAGHEIHEFRQQTLCIRIDLLQVEVRMPPLEIPAAVALNFVSPNSCEVIVVIVVIVMTCSFQGINAL